MREKKMILTLLGIFALCMFCTVRSEAKQKSIVDLKEGITYTQYDVTGDGKADRIYIYGKTIDEAWYSQHKVFINGQCLIEDNIGDLGADAKILTFADGTVLFYLVIWQDNGDGEHRIFQYKNGKMIKKLNALELLKNMGYHDGVEIVKIKGNTLYLSLHTFTNAFGFLKFSAEYKCKNGSLMLSGHTHKVIEYTKNGSAYKEKTTPYMTAARTLQIYKDASAKKKSFQIKKGTQIKTTKVHIDKKRAMFYITTKSGKKGWCISPKKYGNPFVVEAAYAG